jgi:hypothetical protein
MSFTRNYTNKIPSSIIGYGSRTQTFQTYDGIITGEGTRYDITIDTLQKQISDLDERIDLIDEQLARVGLTGGSTTLSCAAIVCNSLETGTLSAGDTSLVQGIINGSLVMDSKIIYLKSLSDNKNMIQGDNGGGVGFPLEGFLEMRGERGGALSSWKGGARSVCMDFGDERIRSLKTFQAGVVASGGTYNGSVSFAVGGTFLFTPCIVATSKGNASNTVYTVRITSVSTTGFSYERIRIDFAGVYWNDTEAFSWVAMDPTSTNIFA